LDIGPSANYSSYLLILLLILATFLPKMMHEVLTKNEHAQFLKSLLSKLFSKKNLHQFFIIGVCIKAFDGIVEILAGIALFFPAKVIEFLHEFVLHKLLKNSSGPLGHYAHKGVAALSQHTGLFIMVYLLSHGIIKIFLVAALLYRKIWAYPLCMVIFTGFVIYQLYRYTSTHSLLLIFLTVLDLFVIALTWHEYTLLKKGAI
jgi:uncharacterized membrane protein